MLTAGIAIPVLAAFMTSYFSINFKLYGKGV